MDSYKGARESWSCGSSVDWRVLLALIPNPWDEMNLLILRGSLGKDRKLSFIRSNANSFSFFLFSILLFCVLSSY